jgi:hypothetical protein
MINDRAIQRTDWWRQPLALALGVSLLLHALCYGTWRVGRAYGWWDASPSFLTNMLARLSSAMVDAEQIQEALTRQQQRAAGEMPLTFVEVSPAQASTERPENPQFYSALNARAASEQASATDAELPQIDGEQDKVVKTTDVPRNNPAPAIAVPPEQVARAEPEPETEPAVLDADRLQPSPEPEAKAAGQPDVPETAVVEAQATTPGTPDTLPVPAPVTPKPGDLARTAIATQRDQGDGAVRRGDNGEAPQTQPRPRTLAQARAQLPQENAIAGQKMRQEGASRLQRVLPSFNTEATPWGSYDAKFIAIVTSQWYRFLDQHPEAFNWAGRVVVKFRLQHDGRITDFEFLENTSGEIQGFGAQKAIIRDLGHPYDPWPPSLRRITGKDYRELRFTFYYN